MEASIELTAARSRVVKRCVRNVIRRGRRSGICARPARQEPHMRPRPARFPVHLLLRCCVVARSAATRRSTRPHAGGVRPGGAQCLGSRTVVVVVL